MFDTVWGVPVHILVTHLVVVIGPLSTLLAIAYAVRPAWRARLRLPVSVGAVVTGLSALVAGESGEQLERRVLITPELIDLTQLQDHTQAGDIAKVLCLAFMVVTLVVVVTIDPGSHQRESRAMLHRTALTLMALISTATLASIIITGHLGAQATWSPVVHQSAPRMALLEE